ncbi:MAG: nucleotide exchange factor GrpE [Caulobacteraceae bacterium]|nr:nucleotide exchange factor GrpE [Caulobacteraceae bacterium]
MGAEQQRPAPRAEEPRVEEPTYQGPDGAETLEEMVQRLAAEAEQWKDAALRAKAEAENTRRRAERELNDGKAYAIQRFARDLLAVADNLARALAATPAADADPAVKNLSLGVEMVEKELQGAFERNGLKRIAPVTGDRFDPHVHQAVSEMPAEGVAPGSVANVMQVGYELFGRVIRPAMVVVAAKSPAAQAQGADAYAKAAAATGDAMDRKA